MTKAKKTKFLKAIGENKHLERYLELIPEDIQKKLNAEQIATLATITSALRNDLIQLTAKGPESLRIENLKRLLDDIKAHIRQADRGHRSPHKIQEEKAVIK